MQQRKTATNLCLRTEPAQTSITPTQVDDRPLQVIQMKRGGSGGGNAAKDGTLRQPGGSRRAGITGKLGRPPGNAVGASSATTISNKRDVTDNLLLAAGPPRVSTAPSLVAPAALSSEAASHQKEGASDNWDDDFEEAPGSRLAALRPSTQLAATGTGIHSHTNPLISHLDQYDDDFAEVNGHGALALKRSQPTTAPPSSARQATPPSGLSAAPPQLQHKRSARALDTSNGRDNPQNLTASASKSRSLSQALHKYSEKVSLEDYEADFDTITDRKPDQSHSLRLSKTRAAEDPDFEEGEFDPFADLDGDERVEVNDLDANAARDKHARLCQYVGDLVERLESRGSQEDLIDVCDQLVSQTWGFKRKEVERTHIPLFAQDTILAEAPEMKQPFFSAHGALSLVQLLEANRSAHVTCRLLGVLNLIIFQDPEAQENLCLIGAIPVVMSFTAKHFTHDIRLEAAHFVYAMCSTSSLTLQFVLSCRGLKTLVELIDEDYNEQKDLVWLGVGCVNSVMELQVSPLLSCRWTCAVLTLPPEPRLAEQFLQNACTARSA